MATTRRRIVAGFVAGFAGLATIVVIACAPIAGLDGYSVVNDSDAAVAPDAPTGPVALPSGVTISPGEIVLPDAPCGPTAASSATVTLTNPTDTPVSYELHISETSGVVFAGGAFEKKDVIGPKTSAVVTLNLVSSPLPRDVTDDLVVTIGEDVSTVPIRGAIRGGQIELAPTAIDFGEVRQNTSSADSPIEITNLGNDPITITGFALAGAGTDFSIPSGSLTILPDEKKTTTITLTPGLAGSLLTAEVTPILQSPVCGSTPKLTVSGTRVNQDVTVNPATVDFGDIDCTTSSALTKTIVVSNYAVASAATITATVQSGGGVDAGTGSQFKVTPASATVPAATSVTTPGTVTLTVSLNNPISTVVGAKTDAVTIVVNGASPGTKVVSAKLNVVGATVNINPTTLIGVGSGGKPFVVTNVGNKGVALKHQSSTSNLTVSPSNTTVAADASATVYVRRRLSGSGNPSGKVTTTADSKSNNAKLCVPAADVNIY